MKSSDEMSTQLIPGYGKCTAETFSHLHLKTTLLSLLLLLFNSTASFAPQVSGQ